MIDEPSVDNLLRVTTTLQKLEKHQIFKLNNQENIIRLQELRDAITPMMENLQHENLTAVMFFLNLVGQYDFMQNRMFQNRKLIRSTFQQASVKLTEGDQVNLGAVLNAMNTAIIWGSFGDLEAKSIELL